MEKPGKKMKKFCVLICILLVGCSDVALTLVKTEGQASDIVDETKQTSPTVNPTITVPLTPTL